MTNSMDRKWKINQCLQEVVSGETKDKTLSRIMINWGASKKTAHEYLMVLVMGEFISINDGFVKKLKGSLFEEKKEVLPQWELDEIKRTMDKYHGNCPNG